MIHPQAGAAIQKDSDGLEERADRDSLKFSKDKCKVLPQERRALDTVQAGDRLALQRRGPEHISHKIYITKSRSETVFLH